MINMEELWFWHYPLFISYECATAPGVCVFSRQSNHRQAGLYNIRSFGFIKIFGTIVCLVTIRWNYESVLLGLTNA